MVLRDLNIINYIQDKEKQETELINFRKLIHASLGNGNRSLEEHGNYLLFLHTVAGTAA